MDTLSNEYAITVYTMINHSLRLDAMEMLKLVEIYSLPHMKEESDRRKVINSYKEASRDMVEELIMNKPDDSAGDEGIDKLRLVSGR